MIGICYSVTNQHNQALRYITLAYIEDTLNVAFDHEDDADTKRNKRVKKSSGKE